MGFMKFRWTVSHTIGLIIGVIFPFLALPLVVFLLSQVENLSFDYLWEQFLNLSVVKSKYISLSLIFNLLFFYFFLNKEKYDLAKGIIAGTILYFPYILYVNFLI